MTWRGIGGVAWPPPPPPDPPPLPSPLPRPVPAPSPGPVPEPCPPPTPVPPCPPEGGMLSGGDSATAVSGSGAVTVGSGTGTGSTGGGGGGVTWAGGGGADRKRRQGDQLEPPATATTLPWRPGVPGPPDFLPGHQLLPLGHQDGHHHGDMEQNGDEPTPRRPPGTGQQHAGHRAGPRRGGDRRITQQRCSSCLQDEQARWKRHLPNVAGAPTVSSAAES